MANLQLLIEDCDRVFNTPTQIREDIASAESDIKAWEAQIIHNEHQVWDLMAEIISCRCDISLAKDQLKALRARLAARPEVIQ